MRRATALLTALLLLVTISGCGRDEDSDGRGADPDQNTETTSGSDRTEPADDGMGMPNDSDDVHGHTSATFPAADATDTAKISMRDFAYVDMPATVTGPRVIIEAKNNGPSAHEALVFDADANEVAGTGPVPSGETAKLSVELTAGTYELRCLIAISETETHFDRGMRVTFAVM